MIPFCMSVVNQRWWRQWAKDNGRKKPEFTNDYVGSLRALTPFVGKVQAATLIHLAFTFEEHFEIPGVGLVLLDQAPPNISLYIGQASVLHWVSLNDQQINSKLRSMGILSWWTAS